MRGFGVKLTFLGLGAFASAALPREARADFFVHRWENQHLPGKVFRLAPELTYYTTGTNYRSDGSSVIPGTLDAYKRVQSDVLGAYGFTPKLTAYARVSWISVQIDDIRATVPSTSGLADQSVGLNYRLLEPVDPRSLSVDFQLQLDFPLYDNLDASAAGLPSLGDETTDVTIGGFVAYPVSVDQASSWAIHGGLGFTKRSDDFPSGLPFSAEIRRSPSTEGFTLGLGFLGYISVGGRDLGTQIISGSPGADGSFIVNSPKPQHFSLRGTAGWDFSRRTSAWFALTKTVAGQMAPDALYATVGLALRFGEPAADSSGSEERQDPAAQRPEEYGRSNRGFVNYGLEARVLRTNDRLSLIKIDKGSDDGVAVGQTFDVFRPSKEGDEAVARARVSSVKSGEAVLQVIEYYREIWIDEGFVAKRPI